MGNKNTTSQNCPDASSIQKDDTATGSTAMERPPGPSPELLASLQFLGEDNDYTLLPKSLHQIAEAYSLKEDYQCALHFLHLEKLYHERLLSNLVTQQEDWERQWREKKNTKGGQPDDIGREHIEALSQICRTHQKPSLIVEKDMPDTAQEILQYKAEQCDEDETASADHEEVNKPESAPQAEGEEPSMIPESDSASQDRGHREEGKEEDGGEEDLYEEGQEVEEEEEEEEDEEEEELCEETPDGTPEEEELKLEWPAGVTQASAKDLVKLSHTEGSSSPDGLVSILKRRRASLDGLPPSLPAATKHNSKRKVRFSEPEDGLEQDEVGGDSCLILLLLCMVTVIISIGGTALYCTLVDTYSNVCTDFSHNGDFYVTNVRRFLDELRLWLPL